MKVDPRFLTSEGLEIFTGNELVVKGALEAEGGTHLLGGYPGSPISGFFDAISLITDLIKEKGIHAVINNNEALAAAMLNGSQTIPCRSIICMKSVGVHVAADALALGNLAGPNPEGGAIIIYGDDPWSDSTQVPADSRYISKHLHIPVIEPANPQEIKDYVDLCFRLSREAELYAGFVLTTNLADGGGTVQCRPNQYPKFNVAHKIALDTSSIDLNKRVLLPPKTWWQEETLAPRFARARAAAGRLGLNRIDYPADSPRPLGFVTSGLAHGYLVQTLLELGLLGQYPILKLGMTYPVDPEQVRRLAGQCRRIVVVEERRGFIEEQIVDVVVKDRQTGGPAGGAEVWGKEFPGNLRGIPATRGLHPSIIAERLVPLLKLVEGNRTVVNVPAELDLLDREIGTIDATAQADLVPLPARVPTFCPGCPHRDSANVCLEIRRRFMDADYMARVHHRGPADLVFHGDTGCYTMLMFPPNVQLMHDYSGMGLGGGTGSGTDPFITNKKVVFMGDSTFFHSGQIAVSQAIKFGQDITFVILDNHTTAMTGHQPTPGVEYDLLGNATAVQDIEEVLRGMGATADVPVVRADPEKRKEYAQLLEKTFLADGVKVVIADKECGITRMRRRRRAQRALVRRHGFLPAWDHMNINQEVCRFCLACAELTACPGLKHVQTDYGLKMDTDITWCVNDGACERIGACSSFEAVTIRRKRPPRSRVPELGLEHMPDPERRPPGDLWRACLVGVGGMGIGLATSLLVRAGHKEGYEVVFVDKRGLAIRNGSVVSQVVYNISHQPITAIIPYGKADLLIGIDILEAARTLDPAGRTRIASCDRTAAVINTDKIATIRGLMGEEDYDVDELERIIRNHTRSDDYLARNISRICEKYLGSKLYANIMMLGFAFQKGLIPVSMHSMAWAIKDTIRTDVRKNLYAFNMGRKLVVQTDLFQGAPRHTLWRDTLEEKCRYTIRRYRAGQRMADQLRELAAGLIHTLDALDESLKRAIVIRLYDCMRWGGIAYAQRYAGGIAAVFAKDSAARGFAATKAVIFNLAGAMLIKDAVFIAELATSREKHARDREKYNVNPANGDRIIYRHLIHAPIRLGRWTWHFRMTAPHWMFQWLKRMAWLRKVLPRWHKGERDFLRRYEAWIADFAYDDSAEHQRGLALLQSPQCMTCLNPRCREAGCPLDNRIPEWLELAGRQEWRQAAEMLHQTNNFPEFTARICPAPCQAACKSSINGYGVAIREIELEIIDRAWAQGWIAPQVSHEKTLKRVAIVGSGPAGLAAAQQLARAGHQTTVFERDDAPGGLLRCGIPASRLPKDILDRRIEQLKAEGVTFKTATYVGTDVPASRLREEFDAICLATGALRPRDLKVPGREKKGVYFALDFLRQQNLSTPPSPGAKSELSAKGKVVVVIGGGETGNDCVETALLQGAKQVHQFEILPADGNSVGQPSGHAAIGLQGPAGRPAPISPGQGESTSKPVGRRWCVATKEFIGGERLRGLSATGVRWVHTSNGRRMITIPGSEFIVKADLALLALGYDAVIEPQIARQLGLGTDDNGRAKVNDSATAVPGVFVAGDAASGASLVATAIHSGRKAAHRIHQYLSSLPTQETARAMEKA